LYYTASGIITLCRWPSRAQGERGRCPGYDDNEEAPIGCSVIKDTLVNMGVIHQ